MRYPWRYGCDIEIPRSDGNEERCGVHPGADPGPSRVQPSEPVGEALRGLGMVPAERDNPGHDMSGTDAGAGLDDGRVGDKSGEEGDVWTLKVWYLSLARLAAP